MLTYAVRALVGIALHLATTAVILADTALVNGNAESGTLAGWSTTPGNAPIVATTQVVETLGTVTPFEGAYFFSFAGAPQSGTIAMQQAGLLSASSRVICLRGWYQTEFADFGEAILRVRTARGALIASATSGPLRSSDLTWTPLHVGLVVPEAGETWEVELRGTLVTGTFVNLFYDAMTLTECALGDLNGDGIVNAVDLSILLGAWGSDDLVADINGDGVVNSTDLALLLGGWTG